MNLPALYNAGRFRLKGFDTVYGSRPADPVPVVIADMQGVTAVQKERLAFIEFGRKQEYVKRTLLIPLIWKEIKN